MDRMDRMEGGAGRGGHLQPVQDFPKDISEKSFEVALLRDALAPVTAAKG